MIFLNLFIAVILESFTSATNDENDTKTREYFKIFNEKW